MKHKPSFLLEVFKHNSNVSSKCNLAENIGQPTLKVKIWGRERTNYARDYETFSADKPRRHSSHEDAFQLSAILEPSRVYVGWDTASALNAPEKWNHLDLPHSPPKLLSKEIKELLIKKAQENKEGRLFLTSSASSHLQLFLIFARVKSTENFCNWRPGKWSVRLLPTQLPHSLSFPSPPSFLTSLSSYSLFRSMECLFPLFHHVIKYQLCSL